MPENNNQPPGKEYNIARIETAMFNSGLDGATVTLLQQMEARLLKLETANQNAPSYELQQQIEILKQEKGELRKQLLSKDEIIAQQENTQRDLEASLAAEQGKGKLKQQALAAIEEKDYDKAEELLKKAAEERMKQVADDFYQLGTIKELKLEYVEALKYYELAANIPPYNTDYLSKAAQLCWIFGKLERAMQLLQQALDIDKEQHGEESSYVAVNYNDIGLVWHAMGNIDESISSFEKALNICLQIEGTEHCNIATYYNNLGTAWIDKGNLDHALSYLEKALKIKLKLYGEETPDVAINYNNLGNAWMRKGDLKQAANYFEKALNIDLKLFGENNPKIALRYNNLGNLWYNKNDINMAIEFAQKSYSIFFKLYGVDNPSTKKAKENLDWLLSEKGVGGE